MAKAPLSFFCAGPSGILQAAGSDGEGFHQGSIGIEKTAIFAMSALFCFREA